MFSKIEAKNRVDVEALLYRFNVKNIMGMQK